MDPVFLCLGRGRFACALNTVIAGTNVLAVDTVGAALLGYDPQSTHLVTCDNGEVPGLREDIPKSLDRLAHGHNRSFQCLCTSPVFSYGDMPYMSYQISAEEATNGGRPYLGVNNVPLPSLPLILILTTVGTGSEVIPVVIINDPADNLKKAIISLNIMARAAVIDPELTVPCPLFIIAITG